MEGLSIEALKERADKRLLEGNKSKERPHSKAKSGGGPPHALANGSSGPPPPDGSSAGEKTSSADPKSDARDQPGKGPKPRSRRKAPFRAAVNMRQAARPGSRQRPTGQRAASGK